MLEWKEGLPELPDNSQLPEIVDTLLEIQYHKERDYGSSWKGKGEYRGIMANLDRKYDRLDKMTDNEIEGVKETLYMIEKNLDSGEFTIKDVGESKVDAIADLANYCLLYLTYIKQNYPKLYSIWEDKNCPSKTR